ncbi:MAG: cyclic nucleotide-binding domain-containing protein [Chloroflexales bacterium]|nr:cyclic nucleotide-binding domain-containing protein [Chloroflexales bacterium]
MDVRQASDPACYRPQRIADVGKEVVVEGGQTFIVMRSPTGNYLRLTNSEYDLWQSMDGSQTVAQLATIGFLRYKKLLPVAELVQNLKQQGFLTDTATNTYQQLRTHLEQRSIEGQGRHILKTLHNRLFTIEGLDRFITTIYRGGGWVFFTRPFLIFHAIISIAGFVAFTLAMIQPSNSRTYQLLDTDGVTLSLLALWAAVIVSFTLHELAHALAVKHYGRRVLRGGVMLYYGMPAAFVDTSDIWLAKRTPRIVVSLAGPLSDVLLGGIFALFAFAYPDALFSPFAYKLAFACYITTLLNLNPLLELDGYYVLMDWLRLPNLRRRALDFVSGPFWSKLRTHTPLDREERIFRFYGLLSAIYTVAAIVLAIIFWQRQLTSALDQLWLSGWGGQLLATLIIAVVVVPFGFGLLLAVWELIRHSAKWVKRRGYSRQPWLIAVALSIFVSLLALLPIRFAQANGSLPWSIMALPSLLLLIALLILAVIRPDYRGAKIARAIDSLFTVHILSIVVIVGRAIIPQLGSLWAIFDGVSLFLLLIIGLIALSDVDLHQAPRQELALTMFLLITAFVLGGAAIIALQQPPQETWLVFNVLAALPIYCGAAALALLLPHLLGLRDSDLFWCWLPVYIGVGGQIAAYAFALRSDMIGTPLDLALNTFAAGMWVTAWSVHYVTLRGLSPDDLVWSHKAASSEAQRLQQAFQYTYMGCYRLLRSIYGARRAKMLDDRMDILAATADWEVTLDLDRARIGAGLAAKSLDVQGIRYAEVLRYTVATIEEISGASIARRIIQTAYDALPWPEREAANRRCFPNTPWARELSRAFGDARAARLRLLRQVDLLAAFDDSKLKVLAAVLQSQQYDADTELLAAESDPPGLWIIEAGEITVWRGEQLVDELHRSDVFGVATRETSARSQDSETPGNNAKTQSLVLDSKGLSYRTSVASTLLFLPAADFQSLVKEMAADAISSIETVQILRFLERVPLFADTPRHTLRRLAPAIQRLELAPRSIVIRQGQPSGMFYLIEQGQVAVVIQPDSDGATETPPAAQVASWLGPEEFFGELELLRSTTPNASVVTAMPTVLLALPHTTIAELLVGSASIARGLEQIGTARLRHNSAIGRI